MTTLSRCEKRPRSPLLARPTRPQFPALVPPGRARTRTRPLSINKTPYVREQDPAWYEQEVGNRRERIEQLNDQMLQIENVRQSGQGISSAVPLDKSSSGITPEETIKSIENQKNQIQTEIDDLQEQAQRNGISRDAWR